MEDDGCLERLAIIGDSVMIAICAKNVDVFSLSGRRPMVLDVWLHYFLCGAKCSGDPRKTPRNKSERNICIQLCKCNCHCHSVLKYMVCACSLIKLFFGLVR